MKFITRNEAIDMMSKLDESEISEFLNIFGDNLTYEAQEVIDWIGF